MAGPARTLAGTLSAGDLMSLHIHKVISALPDPLEPDAVYAVRSGSGFDLYVADSTGTFAHRHNGHERHEVMTQAEYDALATKDPETFYYIPVT